jgi:branched-chain amino acid transport system substrate-binding protein
MLHSRALAKIQSAVLIAIVVVATVGGITAYVFLGRQETSSETIKIGIIGDLDTPGGKSGLEGALLAAEQINAEGGVLDRLLEIVPKDDESATPGGDPSISIAALSTLITLDKVDFVIGMTSGQTAFSCQDVSAEHKKIYLSVFAAIDELSQRVHDDYEKYKYFFKLITNGSVLVSALVDNILYLRELTGFNKIAYLSDYYPVWDETKAILELLPENHGFELVWSGETVPGTVDFTSYFAAAEAAGAEVLITLFGASETIPFAKEYHDRQSPMVIWGYNVQAGIIDYWESTDEKCEYTTFNMNGIMAGYPVTNKTLATREALLNRWSEIALGAGCATYDALRFVLVDAVERAGTTETEAVMKALEETNVVTSNSNNLEFSSSHEVLIRADSAQGFMFQWQADGALVPVYPKEIMEEAGATYTFPDWPGPWD